MQKVGVAPPVLVIEETGRSVVAALHNVLRDSGQVDAWQPGHATSVAVRARARCRPMSSISVGEVNLAPFRQTQA